ncbi:N-acetyltransferase family protein [Promethearchaeum syntrophicum]|uniref:N-acetyltransferase family protein n=1 Tax=Promethearchaeum syntrophicum TaxID=2594042 RepID=A0A5B9DHH9_9ARCH|nr:GNAT family protein [Candidatus Prometheoarchaeum syntrophicum]QEE18087.1 putative acetyltransferase YhhY [Candidatus Prometheoarchaeum syntrophicum]
MEKNITLKSGLELEIRIPTVEDAQAVLNFIDIISGESDNLTFGPGEFDISLEQEKNYFSKLKDDKDNIFVIGLIDGEIVCVSDMSTGRRKRMRHAGEIHISVQKKYWNMGIGRCVLSELIKWGKEIRKLRKINLDVKEGNVSAIYLYESLGFQEEGRISRGYQINGEFYTLIAMGLEL